jgi:hypothetical protein
MAVEVTPDGTIRIVPALAVEEKKAEPRPTKLDIRL